MSTPYVHDAFSRVDGPTAHVSAGRAHARESVRVADMYLVWSMARCGEWMPCTEPLPLAKVPHGDRCRTCWAGAA